MRRITTILCAAAGAILPSAAHANEATVSVNTRYIDTDTFNDVFSDTPAIKIEGSLDVSKHVYVAGYFYTGTKRIARDKSSEYGAEIGTHWDIDSKTAVALSAGRYGNYQGQGFHAGDWYGKVEVTHGRVTASASVLAGASDTVLLRIAYDLPAGKRASITPSVVYSTADDTFNPGISAEYRLADHVSVGAQLVAAKVGFYPYRRRAVVAAANVTWRF